MFYPTFNPSMKGVLSRVTVEEVRGKEVSNLPIILLHLLHSKSSFELRPSDSKAKIFKLKILPWLLVLVSCERLSDLTMSPLLDYVSAWYTPFSRLYCEPYFPGLGQSRGMSGGEFMLGKFLRARDWEVRWSQSAKKIGGRKNILHPRGCQMSQVWQMWEMRKGSRKIQSVCQEELKSPFSCVCEVWWALGSPVRGQVKAKVNILDPQRGIF